MINDNKLLSIFAWMLIAVSFLTVVVTAFVPGYASGLKTMTKENGFFEWMSVVLLLSITGYGLWFLHRYRTVVPKPVSVLVAGFAVLGFLAAMEEISWGQQIFGFHSTQYFLEHNYQKETNLHNFVPAEIFSSVVYIGVYTFFVFLPLFAGLFAGRSGRFGKLLPYLPKLPVVLIVLYGSAFQAYFYDDFGVRFDMGTLAAGIVLAGICILFRRKEISAMLKIAYAMLVAAIAVFMLSHDIFGFFNMQYEIREMFVDLAALIYFMQLTETALPSR